MCIPGYPPPWASYTDFANAWDAESEYFLGYAGIYLRDENDQEDAVVGARDAVDRKRRLKPAPADNPEFAAAVAAGHEGLKSYGKNAVCFKAREILKGNRKRWGLLPPCSSKSNEGSASQPSEPANAGPINKPKLVPPIRRSLENTYTQPDNTAYDDCKTRLTPEERTILELRIEQDFLFKQIEQELDLSRGRIAKTFTAACRKMGRCLGYEVR